MQYDMLKHVVDSDCIHEGARQHPRVSFLWTILLATPEEIGKLIEIMSTIHGTGGFCAIVCSSDVELSRKRKDVSSSEVFDQYLRLIEAVVVDLEDSFVLLTKEGSRLEAFVKHRLGSGDRKLWEIRGHS
jgi:hypothetical protein